MELIIPFLLLVVLWVLVIVPQRRREQAHRAFVAGLSVGDEVVTTAGVLGAVVALDDVLAVLEVAPGVRITVARLSIGRPRAALVGADHIPGLGAPSAPDATAPDDQHPE